MGKDVFTLRLSFWKYNNLVVILGNSSYQAKISLPHPCKNWSTAIEQLLIQVIHNERKYSQSCENL